MPTERRSNTERRRYRQEQGRRSFTGQGSWAQQIQAAKHTAARERTDLKAKGATNLKRAAPSKFWAAYGEGVNKELSAKFESFVEKVRNTVSPATKRGLAAANSIAKRGIFRSPAGMLVEQAATALSPYKNTSMKELEKLRRSAAKKI